uniref:Uncharacterized protein n=1 Tax=Anguilla anguilla TaxID=7936 RepID=A0A0E9UDJ7_ANGAN
MIGLLHCPGRRDSVCSVVSLLALPLREVYSVGEQAGQSIYS